VLKKEREYNGINALENNLICWRLFESLIREGDVWSDREAPRLISTSSGAVKSHPNAALTFLCPIRSLPELAHTLDNGEAEKNHTTLLRLKNHSCPCSEPHQTRIHIFHNCSCHDD